MWPTSAAARGWSAHVATPYHPPEGCLPLTPHEKRHSRAHCSAHIRFVVFVQVITSACRLPAVGRRTEKAEIVAFRSGRTQLAFTVRAAHVTPHAVRGRRIHLFRGGLDGHIPQRSQSTSWHEAGSRRQGTDGPPTSHSRTATHRARPQRDAPPVPPDRTALSDPPSPGDGPSTRSAHTACAGAREAHHDGRWSQLVWTSRSRAP